ncbi:ABC transporter ATP-binding protein [Streptococcus suis]|nr:ABC transporter ATP-binding protein [Streptococcus suis]
MIEFKNVSKSYGDNLVLDNVNLRINTGEFICIIGTSGSGKTTLTRMINKMETPTGGEIFVDGVSIKNLDDVTLRRQIGYVIQSIGLLPHMTIRQNIMLVPKLLNWEKEKQKGIAEELIKLVELSEDYLDRKPSSLSGGQKQRIGVIRALAANPDIILMDEPFGALDPITRMSLQKLVKKLQNQYKKTIVFVTHDMDEAINLADKIIIMDNGKVIQFDTPYNLLQNPINNFVKNLLRNRVNKYNIPISKFVNSTITEEKSFDPSTSLILGEEKELLDILPFLIRTNTRFMTVLDSNEKVLGYIDSEEIIEFLSVK